MKKLQRCLVSETLETLSLYNFEGPVLEVIKRMQEIQNKYKEIPNLVFDVRYGYGDELVLDVRYNRPETDAELFKRQVKEQGFIESRIKEAKALLKSQGITVEGKK